MQVSLKFFSSSPQSLNIDSELIILIGKSNVGKSSFINWISNNKRLAYISKTPGRTQLLNYFTFQLNNFNGYLIDTPGYGFSKMSFVQQKRAQTAISHLFQTKTEKIKLVIFLFDLRWKLTENDIAIYKDFKSFPHFIIFTKFDKINQKLKFKQLKSHIFDLEINDKDYYIHSKLETNPKKKDLLFNSLLNKIK
ncbi:ribosome biogenesis GTP-binding protein YihA/YsxC [Mycoplasma sp. SG1]|uniref:ribosome biogenesis GTP-binding protein YihA/YsxC n=1 Tax=Mycoplasma sp. SG1 TaxID=2810348 RepID=UPI002024250B|nr:ribosome biogenesis GTP-binding protein YihA/YsxC [Mycoplasma sp. SG1]URM52769.1 ribosome biogenesis GTP-binding protein YihA/YsxC [Mycoplasma sp. SG1]